MWKEGEDVPILVGRCLSGRGSGMGVSKLIESTVHWLVRRQGVNWNFHVLNLGKLEGVGRPLT